jgi:hypothetical protein
MSAKPLTEEEKEWLKKLESVMKECPTKRLACYTIGDNNLCFFDKNVASKFERDNPRLELDAPALHQQAGSYLGEVWGKFMIESCQG